MVVLQKNDNCITIEDFNGGSLKIEENNEQVSEMEKIELVSLLWEIK